MKKVIWTFALGLILNSNLQGQEIEKNEIKNQPAIIIKLNGSKMSLDFVQVNSDYNTSINDGKHDFFKNDNPKIRNYNLSKNVKFYTCNSNYPTELNTIELVRKRFVKDKKEKQVTHYYFDIKDAEIVNVYEQCLP